MNLDFDGDGEEDGDMAKEESSIAVYERQISRYAKCLMLYQTLTKIKVEAEHD